MDSKEIIVKKIDELIKQESFFPWEKCSYKRPEHGPDKVYGKEPSAEWDTWVNRIERLLKKTVIKESEPYIYFSSAQSAKIEGNYRDQFDKAKNGYISALSSLKNLFLEGDVFDELLIKPSQKDTSRINQKPNQKHTSEFDEKKVFIVHGHDHNLKIELEVFLSHIGLKPIVLHREVDNGKTIIEKFEKNSDVAYVFVLLTPDEIAFTIEQEHQLDKDRRKEYRARPNVIFEFGYFIAKLGRNRVCALYKENVTIPSDLNGFLYKKVDLNIEELGFSIIKELKAAGLKVQL